MSEVKRYTPDQLSGRTLAVVLSDDYNTLELEAVRLRADNQNYDRLLGRANLNLDTAQSQLAALREELAKIIEDRARFPDRPDFIGNMISAHIGNLKAGKTSADKYASEYIMKNGVLGQRLADAERRNESLCGILREIRQSCELSQLRDAQIDAALNPKPEAASHDE